MSLLLRDIQASRMVRAVLDEEGAQGGPMGAPPSGQPTCAVPGCDSPGSGEQRRRTSSQRQHPPLVGYPARPDWTSSQGRETTERSESTLMTAKCYPISVLLSKYFYEQEHRFREDSFEMNLYYF